MSDEERRPALRIIGTRTVWEKGGSLGMTLPSKVVKFLEVGTGDEVLFVIDEEHGHVRVVKSGPENRFDLFGEDAVFGDQERTD